MVFGSSRNSCAWSEPHEVGERRHGDEHGEGLGTPHHEPLFIADRPRPKCRCRSTKVERGGGKIVVILTRLARARWQ